MTVTASDVGLEHAEGALRDSEERYRRLADSVPELLWSATADGSATYHNQRWFDYTGQSLQERSAAAG